MARKYTTHIREEKVVELRVEVLELSAYMNLWLILKNYERTYKDKFYHVRNTEDSNYIYVCVPPNEKDNVLEFLSQFGQAEVFNDVDKYVVYIDVSCDYDDFDKDYIDEVYVIGETD